MTADLREAFHMAVAAYLEWRHWNEEQRTWGLFVDENGKRDYDAEPVVEFFGKERKLSEICDYTLAIKDGLPPHLKELFRLVDSYEPLLPDLYCNAAKEISECIQGELEEQRRSPIINPSLVDKIRERSFRAGVSVALQAVSQNFAGELEAQ
ncbi:hypothetical protein [Methylobacterium soli]|uniref:Uncharacterized protein n=1 Tax=Methylobacterium soli TaxID=553447 RepID=A0A6L3SV96_9HYPH|nr:hypothetical protein [Methylobacterium soli]KAB1076443.1 hypothetical protein F6X53_23250 [Methylobacterium soli]GJE46950.1 hypothetical protein AEGHOMDF_6159 [Methylobacterium soli]